MKLSEALKKKRIIEKQIIGKDGRGGNCEEITKYASMTSIEKPYFENADRQREEVKRLVQSSIDLIHEYQTLEKNIIYTNLQTKVILNGEEYSLAECLLIQRKLHSIARRVYNSLNDSSAQQRLASMRITSSEGKAATVERYYREEDRNNGLKYWNKLVEEFETKLDVINATTDLLEFK